ncbi:MAG: NUDIX domain-containing protein [Candidatus Nomurabacteria bacterium]|nr:NUDIX domain-containing protein [Candidatus Nomurabacteria bacterium]
MDSLPEGLTKKIGLIITHPKDRSHNHLQYSVYEDQRIKFVIHVNEELTSSLKNGMLVHMISNGNEATLKKNEFLIENIHIRIVEERSLPDSNTVSAVFLIGFIDDKIVAIRNERGWDIPGGHVETTDLDLIDSLKREVDEEGGATFENAKPFATMRFEGKEKVMLFYVSKDCKLSEFIPKEDAFERTLMTVTEFISKYNWKKDVIELLIKKAVEIN